MCATLVNFRWFGFVYNLRRWNNSSTEPVFFYIIPSENGHLGHQHLLRATICQRFANWKHKDICIAIECKRLRKWHQSVDTQHTSWGHDLNSFSGDYAGLVQHSEISAQIAASIRKHDAILMLSNGFSTLNDWEKPVNGVCASVYLSRHLCVCVSLYVRHFIVVRKIDQKYSSGGAGFCRCKFNEISIRSLTRVQSARRFKVQSWFSASESLSKDIAKTAARKHHRVEVLNR